MVAAILTVRRMLGGVLPAGEQLAIELGIGVLAYVVAALAICRHTARDLIALSRDLVRRRAAA
jgi:hypothetical protein